MALAGVLALGLAAEAARIKDEPDGINGHRCGAPLAQYQSFKLVEDLGGTDFADSVKVYENPGEALTLDQVPFIKIRYRFVGEQLESVQYVFEGKEKRDRLLKWIEGRYGPAPAAERRVLTSVQWFGDQPELRYPDQARESLVYMPSPESPAQRASPGFVLRLTRGLNFPSLTPSSVTLRHPLPPPMFPMV